MSTLKLVLSTFTNILDTANACATFFCIRIRENIDDGWVDRKIKLLL